MPEKIEINPDANQLLPLFAKDNYYQPYRFQQNVDIIISYTEYKRFVQLCLSCNMHVLHYNLDIYKKNILDVVKMQKLYLLDVSDITQHEVVLATQLGKPSVRVMHFFDSAENLIAIENCEKLFSDFDEQIYEKCLQNMNAAEFKSLEISKLLPRDRNTLNYSLYLKGQAFQQQFERFNVIGG